LNSSLVKNTIDSTHFGLEEQPAVFRKKRNNALSSSKGDDYDSAMIKDRIKQIKQMAQETPN
jgi:hypothetical protein